MAEFRWRLAEDDERAASNAPQQPLFDAAALDTVERHVGTGEFRGMEFLHVNARTIINAVPAASRMPFRYTINAYRGCSHKCTYCFARPTHEYLGLNLGEDFERRIVVKVNAVERLRAELGSPKWRGDHIAMGTNTDPYQRCEGKYHLTQGVIRVLGAHRNPFSILTKSTLILRDLDLLVAAARRTDVRVNLSIGTLDERVWKLTEPGTPNPRRRVEAVRRLNEAGIACGVLVAPIIPGLSDSDEQLREVVEAVVTAGAVSVTAIGLHLRPGVRDHWMEWLRSADPELAAEHEKLYKRAYLSPRQQDHISERVRDIAAAARGRFVGPRRTRDIPLPPQAPPHPPAAPVVPAETQLGLGL